ncbi:hypothetical protein Cylst_0366 [Cylindrospermum stagnale PCC 7417]|uniref:Spore coat protein U domain-containing protein n=1 Tax=Cylindrospermum stagnale PCC 7417 TaxID=56107 RepID=K9WRA4_9NOST|nr:hypothetical protein [Cylindrospermum stagnale]AFZ22723.1 hypothetical protein Cylst_0366 [Cylindrospermum stagnale PCC 7417]
MFYRLALTTSLMLASAFALDRAALAQSVDIPFNGVVPIQATFSTPVIGTAEPSISGSSDETPTQLESQTPATIGVASSTPTTITVSPPRFVSGPTSDPPGTTYIGFLTFGSTSVRSDVGGGSAALPTGSTNLQVNMLVERPDSFTPGTYTYAVTLTITP